MSEILITGANGFLGYYLTEMLIQRGHAVLATGKGPCRLPFQQENFRYETLDFTDKESVNRLLEKERPAVIVHAGALSKPDECEQNREAAFKTNVTGTINLLEASKAFHPFFIFLSTDFVFDGKTGMYKEEDERNPVNFYGETKVMAEDEVSQSGLDYAIVRTVLVYGKPVLNRGNLISMAAENLKQGKPLKIFDDQLRTPTYVKDLAKGITTIIEQKAEGTWHISGPDQRSPYQMVMETAAFLSLDQSLITPVKEAEFDQPTRRPAITGFNLDKARKYIDYHPIDFKDGLKEMLTTA